MEPTQQTESSFLKILKIRIHSFYGIFIMIVLCAGLFYWQHNIKKDIALTDESVKESADKQIEAERYIQWQKLIQQTLATTPVQAEHVEVFNASKNIVLYEKSAQNSQALASVTKLMTALLVMEYIPEGETITISANDLLPEGENGLVEGETWTRDDLLSFMLIVSSNDAAELFGKIISRKQNKPFAELMNTKAKDLGLESVRYQTASGLDIENIDKTIPSIPGGYGNSQDITKLAAYILKNHPTIAEKTIAKEATFTATLNGQQIKHAAKNTNEMIANIPNPLLSKTGFTLLAKGNLVYAFRTSPQAYNQTIIVTVLGSSIDGRFADVSALASSTESLLRKEPQPL